MQPSTRGNKLNNVIITDLGSALSLEQDLDQRKHVLQPSTDKGSKRQLIY